MPRDDASPNGMTNGIDEHSIDRLHDGSRVLVRPLRADDRMREMSFIRDLSRASRRMRFLAEVGEPSQALLDSLMDVDGVSRLAYIALVHEDGVLREVGVGRFHADLVGGGGEVAIAVADAWQARGLEQALMRHLLDRVRTLGYGFVYAIEFADNQTMRALARDLNFTSLTDEGDASMVIYRLALPP